MGSLRGKHAPEGCYPLPLRGHDVECRCIRRVSQERVHDSTPRFPPLAPAGNRSPASPVLSRRYDFLPSVPPHFVAFVWRYLQRSLVLFAPRRTSAPPKPGVGHPVAPAGITQRKRQDIPSSWGTPIVRLPCSRDAGRTVVTRPVQCNSMAPGMKKAKAPTKGLSTLNSMAFGLAAYASPYELPRYDARLASSRLSDVTGRAFHPQGSLRKVSELFLTSHPPSPSFASRNFIDRSAQGPLLVLPVRQSTLWVLRCGGPNNATGCRTRARKRVEVWYLSL